MNRLRAHPFLLIGTSSFLFLLPLLVLDLQPESVIFGILAMLWQLLGIGPHTVANWLARLAPEIPGWLDVSLIVILGLLPYAAADAVLRRLRAHWARVEPPVPVASDQEN